MSLASYSQTLSKNQDDCLVPCNAVKNALLLNEKHTLVLGELQIKSDSIAVLTKIVGKKDEIIVNLTTQGETKDRIIDNYKNIVGEKDVQLSSYKDEVKKQKTQKFVAWGVTAASVVLTVLRLL
jgi:hypothetical protein